MSIDWITVLAQLVNFLLLVWLLRRFLYRPILDGIDAREAEIAQRMAAADAARAQAQAAEQQYRQAHAQTLAEQERRVTQALQQTQEQREQLMVEAQAQIEQQRRDWQQHLEHEGEEFSRRLQEAGSALLLQLTRKALRELADEPVEAAIARHIGRQLPALANELAAAAGSSPRARVSTQAELPTALQQRLQTELQQVLPRVTLDFRVDAAQAPGLVVQVGGARLAWTTDSYMDELDVSLLPAPTVAPVAPVAAP